LPTNGQSAVRHLDQDTAGSRPRVHVVGVGNAVEDQLVEVDGTAGVQVVGGIAGGRLRVQAVDVEGSQRGIEGRSLTGGRMRGMGRVFHGGISFLDWRAI